MFSAIFEFFKFKKHPIHLWLFFGVIPFMIILVYLVLDYFQYYRIYKDFSKNIKDYFFLTIAPFGLLGVGMFIYSYLKTYPLFFQRFTFHRVLLYFFLVVTVINSIWMLWVQVDTFQCKRFLCDFFIIFPLGSIVITTSLMFIYSLMLFAKVRKHELADTNPYL